MRARVTDQEHAGVPSDAGQDDQSRMQFLSPDETSEIPGVLGHDDPIFGYGVAQDHMVGVTPPPDVTGMDRGVMAAFV